MPQKRVIADQINTNVAGGLLEINGSGKVDTSFLETNVANGVAGLDGFGEIAVSLLKTNVANGIPQLDGSAEIPTSLLQTDVANGVPQLDGSGRLTDALLPTGVFNGVLQEESTSGSGTLPATDFDLSPNTTSINVNAGDLVIMVGRFFGFMNRPHGDANPYVQLDNPVGTAGLNPLTGDFAGNTQESIYVGDNADGSGRTEILLSAHRILSVTSSGTLAARALAGNFSGDTVSYSAGGIRAYLVVLPSTT